MKSPLKVSGIDHVVFHVKDLARSKKFYVELLGMEVRRENSWQIFLRCGSQLVGLFKVERGEKIHSGDEVVKRSNPLLALNTSLQPTRHSNG